MIENDIIVRGAKEHNLKNVSVTIPGQKLTVITGPSGSGKSSLAFDTIFAEGQRRYMESLSSYARQFLNQLSKPNVDFIDGLSPAISIEQKTIGSHPRSTVGTVTGIYDFLRLLFARTGEVRDPSTGEALTAHTDKDITDYMNTFPAGTKLRVFASVVRGRKGEFLREFEQWRRTGFNKVRVDGEMRDLFDPILISKYQSHDIDLLIDMVTVGSDQFEKRLGKAFKHVDKIAEGWLKIEEHGKSESQLFSRKIASSTASFTFPELEPRLFSFNSPRGYCGTCKGLGVVEKPVGKGMRAPNKTLNAEEDVFYDPELDKFAVCHSCKGARLRKEALWVYFADKNIYELCELPGAQLKELLETHRANNKLNIVEERLLEEILQRLIFLDNVGVSYLSTGRKSATLSGGEAQRMRLATQLGSKLSGVLYVLDEPSIGLHPMDHKKLLRSLINLKELGNTVLVVEHDEETMLAADHLIDIGPAAGVHGGYIVSEGSPSEIKKKKNSITGAFLSGRTLVTEKKERRPGNGNELILSGCSGNNLRDVTLKLPLGKFVVFTGVSGSGKSSLVRDTLEKILAKKLYRSVAQPLPFKKIEGLENLNKVVNVNQKAIGRTPRSNPATYTGLFTHLRNVYSSTPEAKLRGYNQGTFSFNVKGGRCDACEGAGRKKIEMHFLPDVFVTCEVCNSARYRREVLEVRYKGINISQALKMSVDDAYEHFKNIPNLEVKLLTLKEVGLGYIQLGQSSTTLSGGEAQRIKLAKELSKRSTGKTIYFLDEPTTGLHFNDVKTLLTLLQKLCDQGNTVVVIEHNTDVVAASDWVVDIGPKAGSGGGKIVFEGSPEELRNSKTSATAPSLVEYFKRRNWK